MITATRHAVDDNPVFYCDIVVTAVAAAVTSASAANVVGFTAASG